MQIKGIIWLDEIVEKLLTKHHVSQNEVREVLRGKPCFRFVEKGHRHGENVYAVLGRSGSGRYLIIFFVLKRNKNIVIVSARDMKRSERKYYEKK